MKSDSPIPASRVRLGNHDFIVFKFKNKTHHTVLTVKTPPRTCKRMNKNKLLQSDFLQSRFSLMQRRIATFSSAPKKLESKPAPETPKDTLQSSIRRFNHSYVQLCAHHDDRCFRSTRIWIQGLPHDPSQAVQIVKHVRNENSLSISAESIASIGSQFSAYAEKTKSPAPMIGSTSKSYAIVLTLD